MSNKNQKLQQFKAARDTVFKISEGCLSTVTDLVLYQMFLIGSSVGKGSTPRDTYRIFAEADEALTEVNYQTFKRAFYQLRRKGLISATKGELKGYRITQEGKERLHSVIPTYNERRTWDKKVYLITYDIPESRRQDRELLRAFLKKLGCGMLQASVWLTPYNPRKILKEFIEENKISGAIIVSDTGKDGSVGEQGLKDLMAETYHLDEIDDDYGDFIQVYKRHRRSKSKKEVSLNQISFDYLSILGEDPQLPFELLPDNWKGEEAYRLFKTLTGLEKE